MPQSTEQLLPLSLHQENAPAVVRPVIATFAPLLAAMGSLDAVGGTVYTATTANNVLSVDKTVHFAWDLSYFGLFPGSGPTWLSCESPVAAIELGRALACVNGTDGQVGLNSIIEAKPQLYLTLTARWWYTLFRDLATALAASLCRSRCDRNNATLSSTSLVSGRELLFGLDARSLLMASRGLLDQWLSTWINIVAYEKKLWHTYDSNGINVETGDKPSCSRKAVPLYHPSQRPQDLLRSAGRETLNLAPWTYCANSARRERGSCGGAGCGLFLVGHQPTSRSACLACGLINRNDVCRRCLGV